MTSAELEKSMRDENIRALLIIIIACIVIPFITMMPTLISIQDGNMKIEQIKKETEQMVYLSEMEKRFNKLNYKIDELEDILKEQNKK